VYVVNPRRQDINETQSAYIPRTILGIADETAAPAGLLQQLGTATHGTVPIDADCADTLSRL